MSELNDFPKQGDFTLEQTGEDSNAGTDALTENHTEIRDAVIEDALQIVEPPPRRIPHLGHLILFLLYLVSGFFLSALVAQVALYFRLHGFSGMAKADNDIRLQLGLQVAAYLLAFLGCLQVMPILWRAPYFMVLSWRAGAVQRRVPLLISAVLLCIALATLDSVFFSAPTDAPIDHVFKMKGAPWLLFVFGITVAPFFEEMAFRGYMLPAFATAYDWTREKILKLVPRPLSADGTPQWSFAAMVAASLLTSILFSLMHAPQNAGSIGSIALLIGVSLVLCAVRLITRSLAASTFVHAAYNFVIFGIMILYTHGFQHMDKL